MTESLARVSNCEREGEPLRNYCLACVEFRFEDCYVYGSESDSGSNQEEATR